MASFFAKIHEFICWILTVLCGWTAQRVYSDDELDVIIAPCVTDDYIRHDAVIQTDGFGICVQCEGHLTPWFDWRYRTRRPEWIWDEQMMSDACTQAQESKGAQVCFHQDYSCGTAAARGLQPMAEGQHYWEIQMDSPVYGTAMMIGIGTGQIDLCQYAHTFCNMLGSDTNNESCGLSYTGRFYHGGAHGRSYCTKFGQGTVIGVHLDMWFGTLTFYQNGKCLGIATKGLLGKVWYPMISSTAARSSMCLQTARSFPSSLQFWCCRTLRRAIPAELNVVEALDLAPGMRAFLEDNLMWLLDSHSSGDVDVLTRGTQTDLSMATHQLSNVPLRRQSPGAGIISEGQGSSSPS
ncbi:SPRY domain-containing SOCS box protein 3-like isoform X2 [Asterias amurensis]|uniref:SPRY domain-containing SOCS box protein 3-like isoform X2 n=1 Tax=Asterias amurensis TaxID=7602 RepID=UPI003AB53DC5